ncbi:MAG: hypothetical protein JSW58_00760 [Candidatus Latescibacterota bacterium]|nr:MAG: hypothetical protein JSW58_00760 [Candidatus Latescibacterota bacterium]
MGKSERGFLSVVLLILFVQLLSPRVAHAGRLIAAFQAGFDSFTEKYSIVEEDTLDKLTEFRARLNLGYANGSLTGDYLRVEGQSSIGEQNYETTGKLHFVKSVRKSRFGMVNELTYRAFRDNSVYTFANDYLRYDLRAYLQRDLTDQLSIRVTDRLQWMGFEERTEFDYDYLRNTIELSGDLETQSTTFYHGRVSHANKAIPDSTEISYDAYGGAFEFRRFPALHRQYHVAFSGERRSYRDESTRSPFWALFSDATVEPYTYKDFGLSIENTFESYMFDADSDVYFDYVENKTSILLFYLRTFDLKVGLGPTYHFFSSRSSEEDEYTEYGAKFALDYNLSDRLWISASYEPGKRDYAVDSIDHLEAVFSDFTVHRFLVYATARPLRNTTVSLFLNHEPEDHKREDDDSTVTLFSLDVTYSF